ncbi:glutamate receptor ionotropic, NMDA 3A [Elysia marginata]|uniref:Glutamate receptor ionotropic, NMDA 3A n=1 Tax=Elysia marginata TaxID=1093978 RepID=A0AAV4G2W2_9GAST|nr:glutamate receptor ionotropic, NMDA 3A [Elysia marginata]
MEKTRPIQGRTFVSLNPDPEAQGRALTQVIGQYNMKQTAVLVEETRLADGFLSGVRQVVKTRRQDIFFLQSLAVNDTADAILDKLVDISTVGWKVILLHASPSLMLRVVTAALSTRLYKTGHAWFLSEAAYTRDPDMLRQLPDGLLAVDSFWLGGIPDIMATSLERILEAVTCLLLSQSTSVPYPNNTKHGSDSSIANVSRTQGVNGSEQFLLKNLDNDRLTYLNYLKASSSDSDNSFPTTSNSSSSNSTIRLSLTSLRSSFEFFDKFRRCLEQVVEHESCNTHHLGSILSGEHTKRPGTSNVTYSPSENTNNRAGGYDNQTLHSTSNSIGLISHRKEDTQSSSSSSTPTPGVYWPFRGDAMEERDHGVSSRVTKCDNYTGPAFFLVNTIRDVSGDLMWSKVGYITASGDRDLKTVLWPGHNIYGPSSNMVKTYRVVTRPAEPFIFITRQDVTAKEDCFNNVPCLQVENSSKALVDQVVEDFVTSQELAGELYSLHCCKGLSLEMLDKLSVDLNFRYVLYFVNNTDYGTLKDGAWTGMVGDVINDVADVVIGAFSMTAARMSVMDFTEPFYKNEFALITGEDGIYVSIWAFMSPFSGQVWLCIMLSSIVAGIATSILEWHSPFGLNPKGRKRTKNYGLGSGLLMVMVLLTGHTINIKAPKSWPGKVIQNVWAGLAIFIMTSYTANLAAYLAGQSVVTTVNSVFDPEALSNSDLLLCPMLKDQLKKKHYTDGDEVEAGGRIAHVVTRHIS